MTDPDAAATYVRSRRKAHHLAPSILRGLRVRFPGVTTLEAFRALGAEEERRRELRAWWLANPK